MNINELRSWRNRVEAADFPVLPGTPNQAKHRTIFIQGDEE